MSPEETVRGFVAAWNRMDWEGIFALLHEDIIYHNMPWPAVEGIAAVRENLLSFGITAADWTLHALAADGNVVLTERVDRVEAGGRWLSIRVMGAFEVEGARIRAWRDYFDPAELAPAAP